MVTDDDDDDDDADDDDDDDGDDDGAVDSDVDAGVGAFDSAPYRSTSDDGCNAAYDITMKQSCEYGLAVAYRRLYATLLCEDDCGNSTSACQSTTVACECSRDAINPGECSSVSPNDLDASGVNSESARREKSVSRPAARSVRRVGVEIRQTCDPFRASRTSSVFDPLIASVRSRLVLSRR